MEYELKETLDHLMRINLALLASQGFTYDFETGQFGELEEEDPEEEEEEKKPQVNFGKKE